MLVETLRRAKSARHNTSISYPTHFNSMKKYAYLLIALLLCAGTNSLSAQDVGTPDGLIQFSTNANGRALGHLQAGTFGDISSSAANWAALGEAPFPLVGTRPYGLRLQKDGEFGLFNMVDGSGGVEDLIIGFGENTSADIRMRYISNQITNTFSDLLVVAGTGQVSVNTDPVSNSLFSLRTRDFRTGIFMDNGTDRSTAISAQATRIGVNVDVSATSENGRGTFGVQSFVFADDQSDEAYGVRAIADGARLVNYGVYGEANSLPGDWAGFFVGRTFCTAGVWTASDRNLKTNIQAQSGMLNKVMSLKTYTYEFNKEANPQLGLAEGTQHGFLAQELETVFPEMVTDVQHTEYNKTNPDENNTVNFKGVKYEQMIPVLTAAMQEQQTLIEQQQTEIEALKARLDAVTNTNTNNNSPAEKFGNLTAETKAVLFQNAPNPFREQTVIRYSLPEGKLASIYVFDMNGRQVNSFTGLDGQELIIEGSTLEAGMYFYSLVIDGAEVDVKRMILTK